MSLNLSVPDGAKPFFSLLTAGGGLLGSYLLKNEKKHFDDPHNYYKDIAAGCLWRVRVFQYLGQIPHAPGRRSAFGRDFYPLELAVIFNQVRVARHLLSIEGYVLHNYVGTRTLLHLATGYFDDEYIKGRERDSSIIYRLLDLVEDVNARETHAFSAEDTALILAVRAQNLQAVQALLTAPNINIHVRNKADETALEIAREYKYAEIEAAINAFCLQEREAIVSHIKDAYLPQDLARQIISYL